MTRIVIPALITEDIEISDLVDITESISAYISGTVLNIDGGNKVSGEASITLLSDTIINSVVLNNIRNPSIYKIKILTNGKGNFTYVPNTSVTSSSLGTAITTGSDFNIYLVSTQHNYLNLDISDYISPAVNFSNTINGFTISNVISEREITANLYKSDQTLLDNVISATVSDNINFGYSEIAVGDIDYTLEIIDELGHISEYIITRKWIEYAMGTNTTPGFEKFVVEGNEYTSTSYLPNISSTSTARIYESSGHDYVGVKFISQGRNNPSDPWLYISTADTNNDILAFGEYLYHRIWVKPTATASVSENNITNDITVTLSNYTDSVITTQLLDIGAYNINESTNVYVYNEALRSGNNIPNSISLDDQVYINGIFSNIINTSFVSLSYTDFTLTFTLTNITKVTADLYRDDILIHRYESETIVILNSSQTGTYQVVVNGIYYSNKIIPDLTGTPSSIIPLLTFDNYNTLYMTNVTPISSIITYPDGSFANMSTQRYISIYESGTYSIETRDSSRYIFFNIIVTNVSLSIIQPLVIFDNYNKLSITNITPTSSVLNFYSNIYDINTASSIYVSDYGTYTIETKNINTFAKISHTVTINPLPHPDGSSPTLTFLNDKLTYSGVTGNLLSSTIIFNSNIYDLDTSNTIYIKDTGMYTASNVSTDEIFIQNMSINVSSVNSQVGSPTFTFDNLNKLQIGQIVPISSILTSPNGTYRSIGTATSIYIEDIGTYDIKVNGENNVFYHDTLNVGSITKSSSRVQYLEYNGTNRLIVSNVSSGSISYSSGFEWGYYNDNYHNSGYTGLQTWFDTRSPVYTHNTAGRSRVTNFTNISTASSGQTNVNGDETYSYLWTGYFKAPSTGTYYFTTNSDDNSHMWVGPNALNPRYDNETVDNGGLHGMVTRTSAAISLTGGVYYDFRMTFGEQGGGDDMKAQWRLSTGSYTYDWSTVAFSNLQNSSSPSFSTNIRYYSNVYNIYTSNIIYITQNGKYTAESGNISQFSISSQTPSAVTFTSIDPVITRDDTYNRLDKRNWLSSETFSDIFINSSPYAYDIGEVSNIYVQDTGVYTIVGGNGETCIIASNVFSSIPTGVHSLNTITSIINPSLNYDDNTSTSTTLTVTVANSGSGNKYYINGVETPTLAFIRGSTYKFDQSETTNGTHPIRLSTTSNGTHAGGSQYTSGWTTMGTPGYAGAMSQFVVPVNAPNTLYYYCQNHSFMGGTININTNGGSTLTVTKPSITGNLFVYNNSSIYDLNTSLEKNKFTIKNIGTYVCVFKSDTYTFISNRLIVSTPPSITSPLYTKTIENELLSAVFGVVPYSDTPNEILDVRFIESEAAVIDIDLTTELSRTVKNYNGITPTSIGARFNSSDTYKKRIEKSINTDTFSMELTANNVTDGNLVTFGNFTLAANTQVSGEYTIAANYDGTTSNLYVNYELISQTTPTISAGTKDFIIGKEYDGYIKNFTFWNYAKSLFNTFASIKVVFHHGTFTASDYLSAYSTVSAATTAGHLYSNSPSGTYTWGTLGTPSLTSTNTTYTWTPTTTLTGKLLMVAGGGGGGGTIAGGGGAGGVLYYASQSISATQKTVVVGDGGTGGYGWDNQPRVGSSGTNTSFTGLTTAIGGGGGSGHGSTSGTGPKSGGSGGGGAQAGTTGGSGTAGPPRQGYDGGNTHDGDNYGGGGGGAGGIGGTSGGSTGGIGGIGVDYSSDFTTTYGDSGWFASGGAGGVRNGSGRVGGSASIGGGGDGADQNRSDTYLITNAQTHTGGGGGGAGHLSSGNFMTGGKGGSGIVIFSGSGATTVTIIVTFHHGTFTASDYSSAYSTVSAATTAGHLYSNSPSGTYTWGTLGTPSLTSTNTTYTWTPPSNIFADVLMVAGGGGTSLDQRGGGGGAGELVFLPNQSISAAQQTVVVGDGGTGLNNNTTDANSGEDTSAFGVTANGGGAARTSGGSGGGQGRDQNGSAGASVKTGYGYGNAGGSGLSASWGGAGGGGGAGAVGGTGGGGTSASEFGGPGGVGLKEVTFSGTLYNFATVFGGAIYGEVISGESWFAGGGGGGVNMATIAIGGSGGGGDGGRQNVPATNGTNHTGGGGGGGGVGTSTGPGKGGSGIVIVKTTIVNLNTEITNVNISFKYCPGGATLNVSNDSNQVECYVYSETTGAVTSATPFKTWGPDNDNTWNTYTGTFTPPSSGDYRLVWKLTTGSHVPDTGWDDITFGGTTWDFESDYEGFKYYTGSTLNVSSASNINGGRFNRYNVQTVNGTAIMISQQSPQSYYLFYDGSYDDNDNNVIYWVISPIVNLNTQNIFDGSTIERAAVSASSILTINPSAPSGNYWIKPANYSGSAVLLWCDMTNLGGGWVLIGKGRQSNDNTGGWFGTENEIDTLGLRQENAFSAGVSKVSSTFVNYLMNGTANGWNNGSTDNYLVVNRIDNATDGYQGVGDSFYFKVTNEVNFKWVAQFGRADNNQSAVSGTGVNIRYTSIWHTGGQYGSTSSSFSDNSYGGANGTGRLFTWHWSGGLTTHGVYHGWSSGESETRGFQNGTEKHPIQFVQLWTR